MVLMKVLREEKSEAIRMRKEGASYSQIRQKVSVSKSTLSLWLRGLPLSNERINQLRSHSAVRIERYRETRRKTRESRWATVRECFAKEFPRFTDRELLIAGLFLYWGEGGKTKLTTTTVSNTDPAMLVFFIRWLALLQVPKDRLRVHVHLYADMDVKKELEYWSKELDLPQSSFRKPYIKQSNRTDLTYPQKFTHGTCNVIFENRDVSEYVLQALEHIRSLFAVKDVV